MSNNPSTRLILATGSLGRKLLMEDVGYQFEVAPADIDEPAGEGTTNIRQFVQHVSWLKAAAVAPRFENAIVIAADSVSWIDGQVIGKPKDESDARRILKLLAGTDHELWTGVTLWRRPDNVQLSWQESSTVRFRGMFDDDLDTYLKTRTWQGCSGGYSIKEKDDPYVSVVDGSTSNVIGLPMETLGKMLPLLA